MPIGHEYMCGLQHGHLKMARNHSKITVVSRNMSTQSFNPYIHNPTAEKVYSLRGYNGIMNLEKQLYSVIMFSFIAFRYRENFKSSTGHMILHWSHVRVSNAIPAQVDHRAY